MNLSTAAMDSFAGNDSIVRLDAPILPDNTDLQNMTIIQTSNGNITNQMFLNTTAAQAISGICVWSALLMTCHQVSASRLEWCAKSRHAGVFCFFSFFTTAA